ncbi:CTP synthase [Simiduia litorea]|uniref:glutamine amidotransferase-related protein n=1 Tax=Simiduia litorea TaxID=1435348 RepID=UPI0036F40441
MTLHIGIIGDFDHAVIAHRAINQSIELANTQPSKTHKQKITGHWLATDTDFTHQLNNYQALWCAPASPYRNTANALAAIRFARESNTPFLGTCGGYQHAALEFARNVLGHTDADNAEVDPNCSMPLITALVCPLVEKHDGIIIAPNTKLQDIYRAENASEAYHCSFGINKKYLSIFDNSGLNFSAFSIQKEPRALEIKANNFFIGVAFQPERLSLSNTLHPIVDAFFTAALRNKSALNDT